MSHARTSDGAAVQKEAWFSLHGPPSLARPVRAELTNECVTFYGCAPLNGRRRGSSSVHPLPRLGTRKGSSGNIPHYKTLAYRAIAPPHPGMYNPQQQHVPPHSPNTALAASRSDEAVAHFLLFAEEEPASYEAIVVATSVPETAQCIKMYSDLLHQRNIEGLDASNVDFLLDRAAHRISHYCEAVLAQPSLLLDTPILTVLLQLVNTWSALDSEGAAAFKTQLVTAQKMAQQQRSAAFTPTQPSVQSLSVNSQNLHSPPRTPPVSRSQWAGALLDLAQNSSAVPLLLPPHLLLEPGFVLAFAEQISAFHRRVLKFWNPANDYRLLFHTPHNSDIWRSNPLLFDINAPHFLGVIMAQQTFSRSLSTEKRAELLGKWIELAATLRTQGDSVGWTAIILVLFDMSCLRLSSLWGKVDPEMHALAANHWGSEAFELHKRAKISFLAKNTFRTATQDIGRQYSKRDCVPYFGDAIIRDGAVGDITTATHQLQRLTALVTGWRSYIDSVEDTASPTTCQEDPAFQSLLAVWAQQQLPKIEVAPLSHLVQPKLMGHYLSCFYQQVLPLTAGSMLPVLFVSPVSTFRLFPRPTLMLASQPKQSNKPRTMLKRSSSFPPAGPPQITGVTELDSGAREQLENTASAHVLARVVRDLLNVGTDNFDSYNGIVFKSFIADDVNSRNSRTSSIIESLNRRSSRLGRPVVVKSATMVRLVDVLVLGAGVFGSEYSLDTPAHIATLLATYRSFCSPAEMLDMLQLRVRCARGAARLLNEIAQRNQFLPHNRQIWQISEDNDLTDHYAVRIMTNILAMLHTWVTDYFFDFQDEKYVMDAARNLLSTVRNEVTVGAYPEVVVTQYRQCAHTFLRNEFTPARREKSVPTWLPFVYSEEYDRLPYMELPTTSLEPDSGLGIINNMIDELDILVSDAFSRVTLVDWMKLFEVLEKQTSVRTGLFDYAVSPLTSEPDVIIQDVFSWIRTLQTPKEKTRVLDTLPVTISALVGLHASLVSYFSAQVADPSLASSEERRERMVFLLKMLGVLRSRMRFFNLSSELDDPMQDGQHVPSFLERALVSAILLPESRAYSSSWLMSGIDVARMFPTQHPGTGGTSTSGTAPEPNSRYIYVPLIPTISGEPVTLCPGWITERLLEIVCCVPNTSVENPDLINFDKRRYAYNLIKNMCSEFQSPEPVHASKALIRKYSFLFGEPARTAKVMTPLIDRKAHKESVSRESKSKHRVFVDTVHQEMEKNRVEARQFDKIDRQSGSCSSGMSSAPSTQSFYGIPVSQSSTSLYSKRMSRVNPLGSTMDVASILDGGSSGAAGSCGRDGPGSAGHGGYSPNMIPGSPGTSSMKRSQSTQKKSRLGGFFKAVRPLSVLGGSSSHGSNSHSAGSSSAGNAADPNSIYSQHPGSSNSLNKSGDESGPQSPLLGFQGGAMNQQQQWMSDELIDLPNLPLFSEISPDEWQMLYQIDLTTIIGFDIRSLDTIRLNYKLNGRNEALILRSQSKDTVDWITFINVASRKRHFNSTKVFSVPLDIVCEREGRLTPAFLETLLTQIENRGLDEVGIYRISGSLAAVNGMKQWFDAGNSDCKTDDPKWSDINAVAGCIKLYFRELPHPIMSTEVLPDFLAAVSPTGVDLERFAEALAKLAKPNYFVLKRLSQHLKIIVDNSDVNKMNVQNIAIVFSVNFLPPVAMSQMGAMQLLVKALVLNSDELFTAYR